MGRGGDGGVEVGTGGVGWGCVARIVMGLSEVRMREVRWRWGWARWSGMVGSSGAGRVGRRGGWRWGCARQRGEPDN